VFDDEWEATKQVKLVANCCYVGGFETEVFTNSLKLSKYYGQVAIGAINEIRG